MVLRSIVGISSVCLLFIVLPAGLLLHAQSRDVIASVDASEWRRTKFGWEPTSRWQSEFYITRPLPAATGIHPAAVAGLQVLASIGALLTFSGSQRITKVLGGSGTVD